MNKKMTKRDYFQMLLEIPMVAENVELVAFIEHEVELLIKKNSGERKATKNQVENEELKTAIMDTLKVDKTAVYTIKELQGECNDISELSNQKVSALLKQLVDANLVERIALGKGVTGFKHH